MSVNKIFNKINKRNKIVKELNDSFDDNNLLDTSNIYTFLKYKYDISNIKDYIVIKDILYIINNIETSTKSKKYSLYVINLNNFITTHVLEFKNCSDAIINDGYLLVSDYYSDIIYKYELEKLEYVGFYDPQIERFGTFYNMAIINNILYLCYYESHDVLIVYNTDINEYIRLEMDVYDGEAFIINNDEYIYIFNYPNLTIFNIYNKKRIDKKLSKPCMKIAKNIYKIEHDIINISNNKKYYKFYDLMINEFKIRDNLYIYNENIYLYTNVVLDNYYYNEYHNQIIDDVFIDELYKRSNLLQNMSKDFGKNIEMNNVLNIFNNNKFSKYNKYYIHYVKSKKLHKKYIIEIYNIAEYLQDIDLEHIKNCIVYLCNIYLINDENINFVYDCLYLLYNTGKDGRNKYLFLLNNILTHRPGLEILEQIKSQEVIYDITKYNLCKNSKNMRVIENRGEININNSPSSKLETYNNNHVVFEKIPFEKT